MSSSLAIDARDVFKSFGPKRVLTGLRLSVRSGTVFGLLGLNGSGKTTFIRILLGLLGADRGSVEVLGLDPSIDGDRVRGSCGVVLDSDGLYDRLSVYNNLLFHARVRRIPGIERASRIDELLGRFGIRESARERPGSLSRGTRQKVAIARALLHRPALVLLDEPFTGLDPVAAVAMRGILTGIARTERSTVLLTSHDLVHVEKTCDDVAILSDGVVATGGSIQNVAGDGSLERTFLAAVRT